MMHVAVLGELYSGAQVALIQLMSPSHCVLYPRGHAPVFGQILAFLWLCWGLVKPSLTSTMADLFQKQSRGL